MFTNEYEDSIYRGFFAAHEAYSKADQYFRDNDDPELRSFLDGHVHLQPKFNGDLSIEQVLHLSASTDYYKKKKHISQRIARF